MPRPHRIHDAGISQHVIVRGNNRSAMFLGDKDCEFFLRCLGNAAVSAECDIHAYVLMTNHVHLMATARADRGLSRLMQDVGRRYVENVNLVHGRTGTLLEGRFKSKLVLTFPHAMQCIRYIEQNPARAGMVARARDYPWSSCRHHLGVHIDALVTEHPAYLALGETPAERAKAYAGMCDEALDPESLAEIRGTPKRGRPRKELLPPELAA